MSIDIINKNSELKNKWISRISKQETLYYSNHSESLVPLFEKELRDCGFIFEISNQTLAFMPKHKNEILPIAIKYYQLAKQKQLFNEQNFFLKFFCYKGLDEVIPILLEDYYSLKTPELTKWFISDCLYKIRSKKYVDDYMGIISQKKHGNNRKMIILLLGKLKEEKAIPILINLLEDEEVRLQVISALGSFKRESLRCYFERFENSANLGWRKHANAALKKLEG